jgi:hypothetical protein
VRLSLAGASVSARAEETVVADGQTLLRREAGGIAGSFGGHSFGGNDQLALAAVLASRGAFPDLDYRPLERLAAAVTNYRVDRAYSYRLSDILRLGSQHSSDRVLWPDGANVFTVLRNWSLQRDTRPRYQFVIDGLREAFQSFEEFDFEQAGSTVTVSVHRAGGRKLPIIQESTGFIVTLLHLVALASTEPDTTIAIDQIEDSLHPAPRGSGKACPIQGGLLP